VAKRLLDDDAPPRAAALAREIDALQLIDDLGEIFGRGRQIEQDVAQLVGLAATGAGLGQMRLQLLIGVGIVEIAAHIGHAADQIGPDLLVEPGGRELADALGQVVAECLVRQIGARDADQAEPLRQQLALGEIVEGGDQQPPREVAGGAEDHHGAGFRLPSAAPGARRHDASCCRCPDRRTLCQLRSVAVGRRC
jgi:hypothetical protein